YHGESYGIDGTGKVTEGEATKLEALVQALHQSTEDTMLAKEGAHE
ncbi:MAG: CRISPR-associated protein, partial [Veillonella sp.]